MTTQNAVRGLWEAHKEFEDFRKSIETLMRKEGLDVNLLEIRRAGNSLDESSELRLNLPNFAKDYENVLQQCVTAYIEAIKSGWTPNEAERERLSAYLVDSFVYSASKLVNLKKEFESKTQMEANYSNLLIALNIFEINQEKFDAYTKRWGITAKTYDEMMQCTSSHFIPRNIFEYFEYEIREIIETKLRKQEKARPKPVYQPSWTSEPNTGTTSSIGARLVVAIPPFTKQDRKNEKQKKVKTNLYMDMVRNGELR